MADGGKTQTDKTKMRRTAACWAEQQLLVRLNKLLADQGLCSRREADSYLKKGWVIVNGEQLEPGQGVGLKYHATETVVALTAHAVQQQSNQDTILLHKPLGIVSCQPEHDGETPAVQLLTLDRQYRHDYNDDGGARNRGHQRRQRRMSEPKSRQGWAVAGRLDINSTGLLVLTQSGRIARQIIGPQSTIEKEYLVRIPFTPPPPAATIPAPEVANSNNKEDIVQEKLQLLRHGIQDGEDFLQVKRVEQLNADQFQFILTAGKHHHIRRMCQAIGLWPVQAIKRVRVGNVVLADLPLGQWRFLQPHERFA